MLMGHKLIRSHFGSRWFFSAHRHPLAPPFFKKACRLFVQIVGTCGMLSVQLDALKCYASTLFLELIYRVWSVKLFTLPAESVHCCPNCLVDSSIDAPVLTLTYPDGGCAAGSVTCWPVPGRTTALPTRRLHEAESFPTLVG